MSVRPVIAVVDGDPEIDADPPVQAARSDSATAACQPARPLDPLMTPLVDSPAPMANIKSQKKRNIQNEKRHQRNVATKSALKTSTKRVQTAAASGDAAAVTTAQREAARALDKAASRGILHKKTAARRKSRLAKTANAASA